MSGKRIIVHSYSNYMMQKLQKALLVKGNTFPFNDANVEDYDRLKRASLNGF